MKFDLDYSFKKFEKDTGVLNLGETLTFRDDDGTKYGISLDSGGLVLTGPAGTGQITLKLEEAIYSLVDELKSRCKDS